MTDIVDELRNECLSSCQVPTRPDGTDIEEETAVLDRDVRWRAAAEIEQLLVRCSPDGSRSRARRRTRPILLFVPNLSGNAAREIVVGVWRFDANRRTSSATG